MTPDDVTAAPATPVEAAEPAAPDAPLSSFGTPLPAGSLTEASAADRFFALARTREATDATEAAAPEPPKPEPAPLDLSRYPAEEVAAAERAVAQVREHLTRETSELTALIPAWRDPAVRARETRELVQWVQREYGVTNEQLAAFNVTGTARELKVYHDAWRAHRERLEAGQPVEHVTLVTDDVTPITSRNAPIPVDRRPPERRTTQQEVDQAWRDLSGPRPREAAAKLFQQTWRPRGKTTKAPPDPVLDDALDEMGEAKDKRQNLKAAARAFQRRSELG